MLLLTIILRVKEGKGGRRGRTKKTKRRWKEKR